MEPQEEVQNLSLLEADELRAAYAILCRVGCCDLQISMNSGVVRAVRYHDGEQRYLLSFILNPRHLLFYLRQPAFEKYPGIGEAALRDLEGAQRNPAGEVTVRIESAEQAATLARWLGTRIN